ncbi:fibronectin type III domain-containing protein [Candidatus Pacearchaeota archaeon]|nr:fibronectin type III domain-containing protein [Candidatus Pacearchaeota archaeon]
MKKILLIFCMSIFLISYASAVKICIDHASPSAPSNLAVSGKVGNILLTWMAATDEPNCSGIAEYVISREGFEIGRGSVLNFTDSNESLGVGEYNYTVYAIDKVGHNTGESIKNEINIEGDGSGNGVVSSGNGGSGGGGSSYVCVENWSCEDWGECVENWQGRLCEDSNRCGPENSRPEIYRWCEEGDDEMVLIDEGVESSVDDSGFFSTVTGAVTGAVGTASGATVGVFVLLALGGFVAVRFRKKR